MMRAKIGSIIILALLAIAGATAAPGRTGPPAASNGEGNAVHRPFNFERDTFGFANMTVFAYENGIAHVRRGESASQERYTRRCFVLSRAVWQFRKFARFDPHAPPIDNAELVGRIRAVTRRAAWKPELPENEKVVFPYADVRDLSNHHGRLLQENVGKGWPTYWRPGNYRVFFAAGRGYQERTHQNLDAALSRGDMFVGYLTTLPRLTINHAVLVYQRERDSTPGVERYLVYDSNHPEGPRQLSWSERDRSFSYEKDWDFVGGPVRVYQVYGKPFQ